VDVIGFGTPVSAAGIPLGPRVAPRASLPDSDLHPITSLTRRAVYDRPRGDASPCRFYLRRVADLRTTADTFSVASLLGAGPSSREIAAGSGREQPETLLSFCRPAASIYNDLDRRLSSTSASRRFSRSRGDSPRSVTGAQSKSHALRTATSKVSLGARARARALA